jgi:hypothetical protein
MDRRAYLAVLSAAASPLAGCSGSGDVGATATVTPAPVPGSGAAEDPIVADADVNPAAVGDAHVEALAGGNARLAVEYAATTGAEGEPVELERIVATVDGPAMTYRRYALRPLELGGTYELFRAFWFEAGEAVTRLIEVGNRSIYREPDDFTPPAATERFERAALVDTLAAFEPRARAASDGYWLAADRVADPARLPTGDAVDPGREGGLAARLESTGLVPALDATAMAVAAGDPVTVQYRLSVTDRGSTAVERPSPGRTFEWFQDLQAASPGVATAGDPAGRRGAAGPGRP